MTTLNLRKRMSVAANKIFVIHGFDVQSATRKGKNRIIGDSGGTYQFDLIASKGLITFVGNMRTRGYEAGLKTDRAAVQVLQAELADLRKALRRPHGIIVNPNGIQQDAENLAKHFGILTVALSAEAAEKVIQEEDSSKIKSIAADHGILF